MTTKTLTGSYSSYRIKPPVSELILAQTARVYSGGVTAPALATVANYGTVISTDSNGVHLDAGGAVINGSATDRTALIYGYAVIGYGDGVSAGKGAATVTNFGTIRAGVDGEGVYLTDGGGVTNGSASDTTALISGAYGVLAIVASVSVTNFGTIEGLGNAGVDTVGRTVTNGSASDTAALIYGLAGVIADHGADTVTNFGTIGGADVGVVLINAGAVSNFGTIHTVDTYGVYLGGGGAVSNGSATDKTALIGGGSYGVAAPHAAATVTNYGRIDGTKAVLLGSPGDRLIAEADSTIKGAVSGGGGTLELAPGRGTIVGLGAAATISGAMSLSVSGFATYQIDGRVWTMGGDDALAAGKTLDAHGAAGAGTVTLVGSLANAGGIEATTAAGLVLSGITIANAGGKITAGAGSRITLAGADIAGGTLRIAGSGGIVTGAGVNILDGSATSLVLPALTALSVSDNTGLTLLGDIANSGEISLSASAHQAVLTIGGAGATLAGGGAVTLGASAGNLIAGAAGAILTNADNQITGAGAIGGGTLTLVNRGKGLIEQTGAVGLVIDTGANTISNAGTLAAAGAGGLTISSAIANTGLIEAAGGGVTVLSAVTGTGAAAVTGARLDFAAGFSENVTFSGAGGVLELAQSAGYAGTISGFSTTGATALDLGDILFSGGTTTASYSGTTTAGVLTVTDGTRTATLHLAGDYLASTWTLSAATGGGTEVVDPTGAPGGASPQHTAPNLAAHPFVEAMAGLASAGLTASGADPESWRAPYSLASSDRAAMSGGRSGSAAFQPASRA